MNLRRGRWSKSSAWLLGSVLGGWVLSGCAPEAGDGENVQTVGQAVSKADDPTVAASGCGYEITTGPRALSANGYMSYVDLTNRTGDVGKSFEIRLGLGGRQITQGL